ENYGMGKVQKKCMQRNLQHIYVSVTFTIAIYTKWAPQEKELTVLNNAAKMVKINQKYQKILVQNNKNRGGREL
ncbi:MAG: hypothetical protein MSP55_08235, partial [Fusobacterium necrophorum]|nr:hypothetical protein [Fusobacterium necrophorum]